MGMLKKNSRVFFATFSPYHKNERDPKNGNIDPMISFFAPRVTYFTLLDQPHPGSDTVVPVVEKYKTGKCIKKYFLDAFAYKPLYWFLARLTLTDDDTNIFFKIRDIVSILHVGLRDRVKYDYFIGFESINTLAGLILKMLGRVDKVIYYVSDYSPVRYRNFLFNWVYVILDRICCYNASFIWDVSRAMHPARIKAGLNEKKSSPVVHVPNALFPEHIKHLPYKELKPFSIVFMGSLGRENGPDLALFALPLVLKKFPEVYLHIIGGGEKDINRLKKITASLHLQKHVTIYGMIPDNEDMLSVLRQFRIGLAPYLRIKGSVRWYGDSLKLRAYMASGIPVITTEVPPLGRELKEYGCAIIVRDDKNDIASSIINLLSNTKLYLSCRRKAIEFGKNNTWDNTFDNAFAEMSRYEKR